MEGLGKRLRSGAVTVDSEMASVLIYSEEGAIIDRIRYSELTQSDWGYVYEKHVAQCLEAAGWEVDLWGLKQGLLDGGIDLIAKRGNQEIVYIQCKFVYKKLGRQAVEQILHKASSLLSKIHTDKKLNF